MGPGDQTSWFYGSEDLPGLEGRYAAAREGVVSLARELRVDSPHETL